ALCLVELRAEISRLDQSAVLRRHRRAHLFPYTTLFRSYVRVFEDLVGVVGEREAEVNRLAREDHRLVGVQGECDGALVLAAALRSEEHTSELQSREKHVCRLLLEKKQKAQSSAPLTSVT